MAGSCCISHEFFKAASKNPNKVAVIHASGGARIARDFRNSHGSDIASVSDINYDVFFKGLAAASSSHPPAYEGDRRFTFFEILSFVDFFSSRLRSILDGGDDPFLIRPRTGNKPSKQPLDVHISESSKFSSPDIGQYNDNQHMYTPKVLGVYMVPSVEYIIAVLSVLRCGEAFMPLDPLWPKERILSVVSSSNIDLIIGSQSSFHGTSDAVNKNWLEDCCSCSVLLLSLNTNLQEKFHSPSLVWSCENKKLRSFCYLMYTSGSTGKPKGVCGTEAGFLNRFLWMQEFYPLQGEEVLLFKTSISFIDHLQEFLGALLTTCTLIIPPFNELKENPFYIIDFLQMYSINRLIVVPSLIRAVIPALRSPHNKRIQHSLKVLVLSGEILPILLWDTLDELLPKTTILNLYGSAEVSGDCTYFDCKRLPLILGSEVLSSVPIGMPISNCDVVLVEEDLPNQGEIYVGGVCVATGYYCGRAVITQDYVKLPQASCCDCSISGQKFHCYYKTGDYARRLPTGDLVFVGRKDRTVKLNGQRVALEEIENALREHPVVVDAAVNYRKDGDIELLEAYLIIKQKNECGEILRSAIRNWMVDKLPLAMIPNRLLFTKSFPTSSTGKVDYALLATLTFSLKHAQSENGEIQNIDLLQVIKKAFCDALMVKTVSNDDDFFAIGGNSISAAHVSHNLGIDMRLLYICPTPLMLQMALLQRDDGSCNLDVGAGAKRGLDLKMHKDCGHLSSDFKNPILSTREPCGRFMETICNKKSNFPAKRMKIESNLYSNSKDIRPGDGYSWISYSKHMACSFSRCNKVSYGEVYLGNDLHQAIRLSEAPGDRKASIQEVWKVRMDSCVDASPIVVFKHQDAFLFIGSHSHKFLCINARSGSVHWEIKLEGRIECSAAILDDFSQVVVGCYQGKIYFLDSWNGNICWTFQTCGEVKSQPVVDKCRHLVWCGSYDHHLYALDYKNYQCVCKLPCGGSVYGSPAINEVHNSLFVASTSGRVTAISIKDLSFSEMWLHEMGVPVFGSLSIDARNGNVICCLVDGHVVALDSFGSIIWRGKTGGPIFAGPCISDALPSQVLICSRDGMIYSFELKTGDLLWEHSVGDPITSSAYVDEHLQLVSDPSHLSDRLVCVCASSGSIHLLRIHWDAVDLNLPRKTVVQEFARMDLHGDIFSSPVMIAGRIFVGCRDDYVHCITVKDLISTGL